MFKARYSYLILALPDYYRTIFADSINEATRIAERYARKGSIFRNITS